MAANDGTLQMDEAEIIFRNFSGRESQFNAEGDRNFCVLLDDATADAMEKDGWNVKRMKIRDEGDTPQAYIQVSVKYRDRSGEPTRRPPKVVLITSKGRTDLEEQDVEFIDQIDIARVDLIVRPYEWAFAGKSGVKAYLKSIYVTAQEDELERRYADVPEIGAGAQQLAIESGDSSIIDAESWEIDDDQKALEA